jgi:AcrR family transcriptional regulator
MGEYIRLSESGKDTEERLLQYAVRLFSAKWYGTVSVAEICRAAGLSNGVFYRYFRSKEELCKRILGATEARIAEAIAGIGEGSPAEKLPRFTTIVMNFSLDHPDLIAVFREGQYRFIEYERSLETLYRRGLSSVFGEEVGAEDTVFALGGIRFCAIRRGLLHMPIVPESVIGILERGIFPDLEADLGRVFAPVESAYAASCAENARDCLLQAGKRLFGDRGFIETNIHEITDAADLAVGTFYTYFASKEEFFAKLVRQVSHDLRRFISANIPEGLNRLEREMRGLWLFLRYLQEDPYCYGIVRQAEFVLPEVAADYYAAFLRGYERRPLAADGLAPGLDEATSAQFLLGVGHYLGIEAVLAGSSEGIEAQVATIGRRMREGFSAWLALVSRSLRN